MMSHVPASEIVAICIRSVDTEDKLNCPLCGQWSAWLSDLDDESGIWRAREAAALRMRRLGVALYFAADIDGYAQEFQQVLALPL
jgi:hypothetical protein